MPEYALLQSAEDAQWFNGATGVVSGDTATIEFPAYDTDPPQYWYYLPPQTVPFTPTHVRVEMDVASGTGLFRPEFYFQYLTPFPGNPYATLYGWDDTGGTETLVSPGTWSWTTSIAPGFTRYLYWVTTPPPGDFMTLFLESLAAGIDGPGVARLLFPGPGPLSISRFQIIVYTIDDEELEEPPLRIFGRSDGLAASSAPSVFPTRSRQRGLRAGPGSIL